MAGWGAWRRPWRIRARRAEAAANPSGFLRCFRQNGLLKGFFMARITVEIADEAAASLRSVVAASGVDEASVIETALLLYGEQAAAFRAFVAEGEADVAAGRVVPSEDVMEKLDAIIAQAHTQRS